MAYTRDKAIELVKSFLNHITKKHSIHSVYLFGSYAKGTQKDYSDIDVALILNKISRYEKSYEESFEIFHEAQEFNSLLEVICFREDEFEKGETAIAGRIKKEGFEIKFS